MLLVGAAVGPALRPASVLMSAPPAAVLFDIDGTLFNSDSLHCAPRATLAAQRRALPVTSVLRCAVDVFREVLIEEGFDDGKPITEEFFRKMISGRSNAA